MSTDPVILTDRPVPRGYTDGRLGHGPVLHIAGQIGWTKDRKFEAKDLVGQFAQALDNVLAVLRAAKGKIDDIAVMTIFVTDIEAYRRSQKEIGAVWQARLPKFYPTMALVGVAALVEPEAVVEIQATCYLGRDE